MMYNNLNTRICRLLEQYEWEEDHPYEPTTEGVDEIISEWATNKADLIAAMENDPNYDGDYKVVLTENFCREVDEDEIRLFYSTLFHRFGVGKLNFEQRGAIGNLTHQFVTEDDEQTLNEAFPDMQRKPHKGAKVSRTIRQICKEYGMDTDPGFNKAYTRFADAINPLKVERYTIISVNPIDYLTMSFGWSWQSCHTIDKTQKNHSGGENYSGCYSAGTLSYMLDSTSVVVYTVDRDYDGNQFELQPKISRQMFHIGEDKIIQGRLYPQGNDVGADATYRQMREIVQRVVSGWFGWDNLWINKKGTPKVDDGHIYKNLTCTEVITTEGLHYEDYKYFSNCNVSYRGGGREKNVKRITVGHQGICPTCGEWKIDDSEYIICGDCRNMVVCAHCGSHISVGNAILTGNGEYFCDEICVENSDYVYCTNVHQYRRETDDDVMYDDYLEEWQYDESGYWGDAVYAEDGSTFCNTENAEAAGYIMTDDGLWYPDDSVVYCEHCRRMVHIRKYNMEYDCCNDCADDLREKEIEEEEEVMV